MPAASEGERIVKLALCVKQHPGITFPEICRTLPAEYGELGGGATAMRRRFERDKQTLRAYGVFFGIDASGGYAIDEKDSYAAPVDLTDAQASLLRLLCSALLEDDDYPLKDDLRMILAKIGDEIDVPDLLFGMEAGRHADDAPMAGLGKARKAITTRKRLGFSYRDAKGRTSEREVEPFGCFLLHRKCYVVAFDPAADGERVFRLDRMSHMSVNAKGGASPDFEPREFDATRYLRLPFQYGPKSYTAQLRFDARTAWEAGRLGRNQGSLAGQEDGSVIWSVEVRDTRELVRWCIENGPGIEPVAPAAACMAYEEGIAAVLKVLGGVR